MIFHKNKKPNCVFLSITASTAAAVLFMNCTKGNMHMQYNKPGSSAQIEDKHIKQRDASMTNHFTVGILWLHGLNGTAQAFNPIAEKLLRDFGSRILLMQPTCREESLSINKTIDIQAKNVFKYIKDTLKQHGKCLKTFPLIIISYSQGGLVACKLEYNFGNQLKTCSHIPITAPLMGTAVFNRSSEDIESFIKDAARALRHMGINPIAMQRNMKNAINTIRWGKTLNRIQKVVPLRIPTTRGLEAMHPDSPDIQVCKKVLRDDTHNRYDVLITCHQNDFVKLAELERLSDEEHEAMERLNCSYARFLTGREDELHDGLIPTRSQLNRGPSLENLSNIGSKQGEEEMVEIAIPGQPNSVGHLYKDVIHSDKYIVLGNIVNNDCWIVPIPEKRNVLYSEKIYKNSIKPIVEKVLREAAIEKIDELALD